MIICGAGSAGKETLGILLKQGFDKKSIVFFDDKLKSNNPVYGVGVISDEKKLLQHLKNDPFFCVAIGHPRIRKNVFEYLKRLGGIPKNVISNMSFSLSDIPENGSIIHPHVTISFEVIIEESCIIHANSVIGHQAVIGAFTNISPLCSVIGPINIGQCVYLSTGSVLNPNITIGDNVFVSPRSLILKDVESFSSYNDNNNLELK